MLITRREKVGESSRKQKQKGEKWTRYQNLYMETQVSVSDAGSGNRLLHHLLLRTNVWGDNRI